MEHTPTESSAGSTLLYTNKKYLYQLRNDLISYKSCHLESIFVDIILPKKSIIIISCIYRHPSMDKCTFHDHYLNPLVEKLSKENEKKIYKWFQYWPAKIWLSSEHRNKFINDFSWNRLHPQVLLPTQIRFTKFTKKCTTRFLHLHFWMY